MAYRYGNRDQITLFPKSIDEYVAEDDPVRVYDAFVDSINLDELGITCDDNKVGNSEYNPKAMTKLLVYGYSYGWRSSRKLERAVHHNISFIWLLGGLKPDHKTISRFRQMNADALKKILKQCVRLCIKLNLIEGNILFVDGTKIRANASRNRSYTEKHYEKILAAVDKRINEIMKECEKIDHKESEQGSLVKMEKELTNKEQLKSKIKTILDDFEKQGSKTKNGTELSKNLTDGDCRIMKSRQGSHASYNVQGVVDDKNSLFINVDAVSDPNDRKQFANQIEQTENILDKKCTIACGDAGYGKTEELEKLDSKGIKVIVPIQNQRSKYHEEAYSKDNFKYDKENNCYICPAGKKLPFNQYMNKAKKILYQIKNGMTCQKCEHFGKCTRSKNGRRVYRLFQEKIKEKIKKIYSQEDSQRIYKRRKSCIEHTFGHIKKNLGLQNFLLRGKKGVNAEISIAATCFNIVRMIKLVGGVKNLKSKIMAF